MTRYDPLREPKKYAEEIEASFRLPQFRVVVPRFPWGNLSLFPSGSRIDILGPQDEPLFFCERGRHVRDYFSLYSGGENAFLLATVRRQVRFAAVQASYSVVDQLAKRHLGRLKHRFFNWPPAYRLDLFDAEGRSAGRLVELGGWSRFWKQMVTQAIEYNSQIMARDGTSIGSLYLGRYSRSGELHLPRSTPDGLNPRLVLVGAVIALQMAYRRMIRSTNYWWLISSNARDRRRR